MKEKYCSIYAEMHLSFDNDFDIHNVSQLLGIEPTGCKLRCETRINPITHSQNPGYWTLKTSEYETRDVQDALDELLGKIDGKIDMIKQICQKYDGEVKFDIVPCFSYNNTPALYFDRNFLNIVHELNACIDIDLLM